MKHAVNLCGVSVMAGKSRILDNVDFKAAPGDFTAILGPSGAGKTTLIKTILGFNKPASGSAETLGESVSGPALNEIRGRIGYVPQSISVDRFFPMLAGDVIRMGAGQRDISGISGELKITKLLNSPFGLLSGGEKQKILLSMALAREPELLLLDEPNLNLDAHSYRDFLVLADKIHKKRGLTVIFVTHLTGQVPVSCKKVVVMKNGRIALTGTAKGILKKKNAAELIYG